MPTFEIDGKKITVEQGTTVLEAARANGIEIPHFCYHEAFKSGGLCRMCLVEIEKMPKLQTACTTLVTEGMVVRTTTDRVKQARSAILEFILTNHPLDCPDCDQAGECVLQEYTHKYGPDRSAFREPKQLREHIQLSELIAYDPERCIMCERCVRYYRDIVGTEELAVMQRGSHSEITTFPGKTLSYGYVGNIADICPVGALTTKDFRFKERVYNLRVTETICPLCEAGCTIYVDAKKYTVFRVRARNKNLTSIHEHPNRNITALYPKVFIDAILRSSFICDDGRFGYRKLIENGANTELVNRFESGTNTWDGIIDLVAQRIKEAGQKIAGIISPFATNEEVYVFLHIIKRIAGNDTVGVIMFPEAKEYNEKGRLKLRKGIQAPNMKGIELIAGAMGVKIAPVDQVIGLKPSVVYVLGPTFNQMDAYTEKIRDVNFIVVQDFKVSNLSEKAHIVIPGLNYAQKDGTYTNFDGNVQRIRKAVDPKGNARNDLDVLTDIVYRITGNKLGGFDRILTSIGKEVGTLKVDIDALTRDVNLRKAAGRLW
ncbi:MAG: 2Fe-2S iron-sulfur cluster-binding protein [bacterium]